MNIFSEFSELLREAEEVDLKAKTKKDRADFEFKVRFSKMLADKIINDESTSEKRKLETKIIMMQQDLQLLMQSKVEDLVILDDNVSEDKLYLVLGFLTGLNKNAVDFFEKLESQPEENFKRCEVEEDA